MYAMLCTRLDVAYSVSVTSRYQQNPGEPHWVAVKNILKYLRRTKDMFLVFGGSEDEISVTGYSDASFQTDRDDFRSQSGYVFALNRGAISWKSSKQDTIADSTTESEYIAASDATKEAVWLRNFLSDLRVVASISRPTDIFCDNSRAVAQVKEPNHKSRHVLRKYHLNREIIGRGDVRIYKIPTDDNVADPLTKSLARVKHEAHACSIGMQYLDARRSSSQSHGGVSSGVFPTCFPVIVLVKPTPPPPPPPSSTTEKPIRTRPPNLRPNTKPTKPYNASHTIPNFLYLTLNRPPLLLYPQWHSAMASEYMTLMWNGTWTLVPRVSNSNVVDCKWVYKLKRDQTGAIKRYKARLVAKGFRQQPNIDYQETFSLVVKSTTICVVLSLATVYLQQPPGFVDLAKPDHVCLLHKSLYRLKQTSRAWFRRLSTSLGFHGSKMDPSLFIYSRGHHFAIGKVVQSLSQSIAVQDMGRLSYFLGIEVVTQGHDILLSQKKYILELLQRSGLSNVKPILSPMTTTANLALGDSATFVDPVKYCQIVGALQYVTLSCPYITFTVIKVCQFMHSPTENHWNAAKQILRYLQGTVDYGFRLIHDSDTIRHAYTDSAYDSLTGFSDADWTGCPDDRRSTGGYAIYLESEYKALTDTVAELMWLQTLLRELRVLVKSVPTLWCDNLGATYLLANPVFHARTKHKWLPNGSFQFSLYLQMIRLQTCSPSRYLLNGFSYYGPSYRLLLGLSLRGNC
ncbi:LOW QUALITY PROTEIN: hypothetical protein OSB04_031680 [Centaurea solstitialis]|uniref:Reverse transcriptase Ty1/copia-type domain-containing protein n=1 Tax=Centaurea solstitialis TaxID=347529 RepID=A0AA38STH7_9ASTR|nr:LOW QUALITY PROTEIN: hypothetical protein OSB04_031680 [Centaurea solstitialis]